MGETLLRFLLLLLIGFVHLVIGYPVSRLLRPKPNVTEIFLLGTISIVLIVYFMGIFAVPFDLYTIPAFLFFLVASVVLLLTSDLGYIGNLAQHTKILIFLAVVAIVSRILQVVSLYVPNWLDGVVHYSITLNILTKGFVSPERIYHAGFHSIVAFLSVLLPEFPLTDVLLITGQWFSFLSGLSILLLVQALGRDSLVALFSAVFFWFVAPFPSYLVSWSRYPLLTGMALFPLCYVAVLEWTRGPRKVSRFLLVVLSGAALFLTHYYVFFLWVCFMLLILWDFGGIRLKLWQICIGVLLLSLLISWRIPAVLGQIADHRFGAGVTILSFAEVFSSLQLLFSQGGWFLFLFFLAGIYASISSIVQRERRFKILVVVSLVIGFELTQNLFSSTRPPGIQNTIILFSFPLVYVAAKGLLWSVGYIADKTRSWPGSRSIMLTFAFAAASVAFYSISFRLINPNTILFRESDGMAFRWILNNTRANDVIAVQASTWESKIQGCDGGAWIPYLTGRQVILMDSDFDPTASGAQYFYKGECQYPLYADDGVFSTGRAIYNSAGVAIFNIEH